MNTEQERPEPAELLAAAVEVVRPAARAVRQLRAGAVGRITTKSTDTDVVTEADRTVERQLRADLHRLRPGDVVLGEEYGQSGADPAAPPATGRVRWLIDPIDGTVNYLYGVPWYAVSVAAELDGTVVAGVVHNAADGREWHAASGLGAWSRGRRLAGSGQVRLAQALVATGFGYDPARRAYQAGVVAGLISQVRDIRRLGAASLDLCLAAEGVVDAYYEQGLHPWDYAAGGLIAAEAGLTVAGLDGAPAGSRLLVAAPPALFAPLHDRLSALAAADGP